MSSSDLLCEVARDDVFEGLLQVVKALQAAFDYLICPRGHLCMVEQALANGLGDSVSDQCIDLGII